MQAPNDFDKTWAIKISFNNELRRFALDLLERSLQKLFSLPEQVPLRVEFQDKEGDMVSLTWRN